MISETTRQEVGRVLRLGKQMEVKAKGIEHPVSLFEVLGIGGRHKLFLPQTVETLVPLAEEVPLRYAIVEGVYLNDDLFEGSLTKLAPQEAEVRLENPVPTFSNLKMHLIGAEGHEIRGALYCKVVGVVSGSSNRFSIHFTSKSQEIETFFRDLVRKPLEKLLTLPSHASGRPTASAPGINDGPSSGSPSPIRSRRKGKPRSHPVAPRARD